MAVGVCLKGDDIPIHWGIVDGSWIFLWATHGALGLSRCGAFFKLDGTLQLMGGPIRGIKKAPGSGAWFGFCRFLDGARYRVRTCDPYRVKVVLYH